MTTLAEFMILSGADNRPPMLEKHLTKKYEELSATEKIQADCDLKATNIILQRLPTDVYSLVNHHRVAKDLWERVQLLMQDLHTTNFDQLHECLEQHELHANEVRIMRERNQDPLALVANHQMTPSQLNTFQSSYNNPQFQQHFSSSHSPQYESIHPTQHYSTTYLFGIKLITLSTANGRGEYEIWRLRIEQYFQVQDYALWDVIENGNSFQLAAKKTTNADGTSTTLIPGPYKDAKTLFATIQTRFSGNEATKKTQKTLLKKLYKNFSAPSTGILHSKWNTYVVVWRNKHDLDTISFDDLYNNLKIVEQGVKGTANYVAFVSSTSSTNEVNTAYGVSTASTQVSTASTKVSTTNLCDDTVYAFLASQPKGSQLMHEDLKQIYEDDLEEMDLKWQLALLSIRTRKFFQKTGRKITINGSDTARYDKSKVECFNCHKLGHFARECRGPRNQDNRSRNQDSSRRTINVEETSSKAMLAIDGAANYKRGLASVEEQLVFYKKNEVLLCEQLAVLKRDISYKDLEISVLKSELEKLKQEKESNQLKIEKFDNVSKSLDKLIGSQIPDKSRKGLGFESYNAVPPPPTGKNVSEDTSNEIKESSDAPLVKELVSNDKKKNVFPTVSKIDFVRPKQQEKPIRKPAKYAEMYRSQGPRRNQRKWNNQNSQQLGSDFVMYNKACFVCGSFTNVHANCNYHQREKGVNTTKGNFNTARPKAVNTVRPNSAVVNVVRANQANAVKALTCWVWRPTKLDSALITLKKHNYGHPQKEDQGYVDNGCSRGGAKGGKITSKGTLKIGKLDFEDVYFVKELQFNLFSVSQMCDKKNNVLFTNTTCFVLSPDFKLTDESQILLKVSRKNNMYSVDMKNIVPK
ncbi:ribonuclease H-like domain-containing protein [Tanacetum coccineum]